MTRIVADVDTGIDDACALTLLAGHPGVELLACSTVSGNTTAALAARNTAAVLDVCDAGGVPVVVGTPEPLQVPLATTPETHGPTGLGHAEVPEVGGRITDQDFVEVWRAAVADGPATLLLTGPLTNLAVALDRAPEVVAGFDQVVIMGGSHGHPGNTTDRAEWNTWCDPHATAAVHAHFAGRAEAELPIVCGLDITETIELTPQRVTALVTDRGQPAPHLVPGDHRQYHCQIPALDLLVNALSFYFQFHLDNDGRYLAHVHDLLAAVIAAEAIDFTARPARIQVGVDVADRGATDPVPGPATARIVTAVSSDAVFATWADALAVSPR